MAWDGISDRSQFKWLNDGKEEAMTRPPVYKGMWITPKVLLALGASEDCEDYKRYVAHWDACHTTMSEWLNLNFLEWAEREGYSMSAFSDILFGREITPAKTWAIKIWNALPETPLQEKEMSKPEIPELPELRPGGMGSSAVARALEEAIAHFTARCDALEKEISQDRYVSSRQVTNLVPRIETLEGAKHVHDDTFGALIGRIEKLEKGHKDKMVPITPAHPLHDTPDDPFAVGKWVIFNAGHKHPDNGRALRIAERVPNLSCPGGVSYEFDREKNKCTVQFATSKMLTPLDGTDKDCTLEKGDEVEDQHKRSRTVEYITPDSEHALLNGALSLHYRGQLRLIRRPPKGESK